IMEPTCRVCMSSSVTLLDIFAKPHQAKGEPTLAAMLSACVACEVKPEDPLPKQICLTCSIETKNAFRFKSKCERSYKLFWELIAEEQAISEMFEPDAPCPASDVDLSCVKIEKADGNPMEQRRQHESEVDLSCVKLEKADENPMKQRLQHKSLSVSPEAMSSVSSSNLSDGAEIIAKGFSIRSLTPKLRLVHSPDYSLFKCLHCSQIFSERPKLQAHLRLHSGERGYKCQHCTESFKIQANLELHMRVHHV
ncbi:hypothetical protein KR222_009350, partial [Zaprionus bogoriensis]